MVIRSIAPGWYRQAQIWLVLDRDASAPNSVTWTTERAIAGGADAVVCRLKELDPQDIWQLAGDVREICRAHGTPFVMSHFPDIAVDLEADAVQIGVTDPTVAEVRQIVGERMAIGYSSHSISEAQEQLGAGCDYVFLGPIFATPAKLKYGDPLGTDTAREAVKDLTGPLVCIGGIDLPRLHQLAEAGVRRVAAIAALQHSCDPCEAVRAFRAVLAEAGQGG